MLVSLPLRGGTKDLSMIHGLYHHSGEQWDDGKRKPSFLLYCIVHGCHSHSKAFNCTCHSAEHHTKTTKEIKFSSTGSSQYQGHFDGHMN